MRVLLYNGKLLSKLVLPSSVEGIFWISDEIENTNLLAIEAIQDRWVVKSNDDVKIIYNNSYVSSLELYPNMFFLAEVNGIQYFVCVEYFLDNSYNFYKIWKPTITLGLDQNCDIIYENIYIFNNYLRLSYDQNGWSIQIAQNAIVYVNDFLLTQLNKKLNYGDVIFVFGLRFILLNGILVINNPNNMIKMNAEAFSVENVKGIFNFNENVVQSDAIKELDYYKDGDFFYKKARVRRFIETIKFDVATPPDKFNREEMPVLLVLGPMLTMGLVSIMSFINVVSKVASGESTINQSISQLVMSCSMMMTSLLWPSLTRKYQKKMDKKKEKERQLKYKGYVLKKKKELEEIVKEQSQIMKENLILVKDCEGIVLNKKINLWERRSDHKDFLTVRVGIGNVPLDVDLSFQKQEFTMDEDALRMEAESTFDALRTLYNVPVGYSFNNKKVTALMATDEDVYTFIDNILLQLVTFHSYDDLKLIFLTNKQNINIWNKYMELPHCFSNNRQVRFFANNIDDIKMVSSYLEQEFYNRVYNGSEDQVENENNERTYSPYYLIITDDYPFVRKIGIIERILKSSENFGFSILCMENRLSKIPSECEDFICLNKNNSTILCTDILKNSKQVFSVEVDSNIDMKCCFDVLQNIPIEFLEDNRYLPNVYGFLEMYNVGKVEQLNSFNRWRMNDPITSLRAAIGVDDMGNLIYLDLHEKFHGPHGLVAGTTGSGKSEFIITYILSMALNYSPEEVAFILIDYKGGGLAGAFENKTQGIRLPHLAGTITNLDKASLNRTLVSIDSELKRRQTKFNDVRDKLGESTIDIYKYQKFYREGKIDEPMPHLFIISDEFAELKSQQPEFMDDLISAARIGRSLGIHLILATQKPSGVVNDQIWSNSKFKICLKVQDTSDSNEMLKQPDAAYITNPGRFFLQVGNNEIFVLGQSGWAGTSYVASETIKKNYDRSVSVIDDVGNVIKNVSETVEKKFNVGQGDELSNVLKYICNIADKENLRTRNLWLDSMEEISFIDNIMTKYRFNASSTLTAVVGEYDAPSKQFQDILTIPVDENGNTLVFSTSGTDKELFLSSYIYSLCVNYSPEDVNMYVIDYGSETFRLYDKFPQVGDVVYPSDGDKLSKLLTLFSDEISRRKKLFADYNGEYKNYIKNSGKKLPVKIMIINNYDSFKDTHSNLEELLIKLSREGERYGIVFVLSLNSSRSIYSRFQLNFHHTYVINMPERGDYMDIFGKIGNVCPAEFEGRGLFKEEETYEFQTARITDEDHLVEFVNEKAKILNNIYKNKAPNIPSLPEVVTIEMLDSSVKDIKSLPLGIAKKKLNVSTYDFFNDKCTIISSRDVNNCMDLLKTIIYGVRKLNHMVVLIDTEQVLSSLGGIVNTYADKNFEEFILRFENFLDREIDGKNIKVLCIISGLEKFQGSLNDKKFNGFFKGIKTLDNLNLIFVDSSHKLKKVQYESWFSGVTDNSNGIWVGSGFTEQSVFKCDTYGDMYKIRINKQFAWVCQDGEAELVKIVGELKEDEE